MVATMWKPVAGFEGYYEVSSDGRVRSVDRLLTDYNGAPCYKRGVDLKPFADKHGYLSVSLWRDRSKRRAFVHQLVAKAYCANPDRKPHVNHLDGDPSNNNAANLEWCTQAENVHHAVEVLGRCGGLKGEAHQSAKLTEANVSDIRLLYAQGYTPKVLGALYGVSGPVVNNIVARNKWKHVA